MLKTGPHVESFELVELKNGVMSLTALTPRETFHPGIGPVEEATLLHVEQQRLLERCQIIQDFELWDVGLGAGANAIAALRALTGRVPAGHRVRVLSFDKTLSPLSFALNNAAALQYPLGFEAHILELVKYGKVQIAPNIEWELQLGDFSKLVNQSFSKGPDAIFYDPYSPTGNPEMWTLPHFTKLFSRLDLKRPCLWTNYTRSTHVRVALLLAGFYVGVGCMIDKKDQTTLASNDPKLIQIPLDREWLSKRVRVSHAAAPLRTSTFKIAPISDEDFEKLCEHPQFQKLP